MTHGERDQPFGCLQSGGFLLGTSNSAVSPSGKKMGFCSILGWGLLMFHSDLFANLCKSRKKGREGWREAEKEGELWGGMHTKIEREEGRPVFLGTPLFVYLQWFRTCSFVLSFFLFPWRWTDMFIAEKKMRDFFFPLRLNDKGTFPPLAISFLIQLFNILPGIYCLFLQLSFSLFSHSVPAIKRTVVWPFSRGLIKNALPCKPDSISFLWARCISDHYGLRFGSSVLQCSSLLNEWPRVLHI